MRQKVENIEELLFRNRLIGRSFKEKQKTMILFFAFSILEWTVSERTHFFSLSLPDRSELHDCESKEQLGQEDHIESFLGKPATDLDSLKPTFSYQKISF